MDGLSGALLWGRAVTGPCLVCGREYPLNRGRSGFCAACAAAEAHTIVMTTGESTRHVATCKCGAFRAAADDHEFLDGAIWAHWASVVRLDNKISGQQLHLFELI